MRSDQEGRDTELTFEEVAQIRRIAELLATDGVEQLEAEGLLLRATAAEIRAALGVYRGALGKPPPTAFDLATVLQYGPAADTYIVELPLWGSDAERCDLTLECLVRREHPQPSVGLWDLRIL